MNIRVPFPKQTNEEEMKKDLQDTLFVLPKGT